MVITHETSQILPCDDLYFQIYEENPFGWIYLGTNVLNGKVYVGKVEFPRTIKERWEEHDRKGRKLRKWRNINPNKKILARHINNAMAKYVSSVWRVNEIDVAFSKEKLCEKETYWIIFYRSYQRKYGYNMTLGGDGGKPTKEVLEKIKKKALIRCQDSAYRDRIKNSIIKMYESDTEYKERREKGIRNYLGSMKFKKRIKKIDLKEFLINVKNRVPSGILEKKYNKGRNQLCRRLEISLGSGINNFTKAKVILDKMEITEYDTKEIIKVKAQEIIKETGILTWSNEKIKNIFIQEGSRMRKEYWDNNGIGDFDLQNKNISNVDYTMSLKNFFTDLKNKMQINGLLSKYQIKCHKTIHSRIRKFLGKFNVTNILEARNFLKDKDIDEMIEELRLEEKKKNDTWEK